MKEKITVIILAAGLGKRMRSPKAKVLHKILGRPMLAYVIDVAREIAGSSVIVVVGNQAEAVRRAVSGAAVVRFAYQDRQLGTGHAVLCALPQLPDDCEQVVVLCGDTPLLTAPTLRSLVQDHLTAGRDATLLAVELEDPRGYGRVLLNDHHRVCGIVEEADASAGQRAIRLINTGIYCVTRQFLSEALPNVTPDNAQGEFYLTDIIRIGYESGRNIGVFSGAAPREILGVNTAEDLARVEALMAGRDAIIS
jgi:UDP-N-acetylglucosamine diphosphorylase/glucosamine-1-phosphate N-acetyltransferase